MKGKVVRIPSKCYSHLLEKGGDKLIGVYTTLKAYKDQHGKFYAYKTTNNRKISGYSVLRKNTNLSLASLKKYVPMLIDCGLCHFDKNGDFVMLGNQKTKELFSSYKIVPVVLGHNLISTQYNVISVRLFSAERQQNFRIEKKRKLSELLDQGKNPKSVKAYKRAERIKRKYTKEQLKVTVNCVLSVQGYALIKDGTKNNKAKGAYWKKKLKDSGIVECHRMFDLVSKMSYSEYLNLKCYGELSKNNTYKAGYLVEERVSKFRSINLVRVGK